MQKIIKKISIENENYPNLLRKITDPPQSIYLRGNILPTEPCFAIVGARQYSDYGKRMALKIAGQLAEAGLIIVSGLALGIDTFVHQAVVEKKKRTIAVLGTGLDEKSIYPKSNLKLAKEILENKGCLLSECPSGQRGSKITFPRRNRIISGLSLGLLVIEAKLKSGSLIAASWARRQKRVLFAIPGPAHSSNSKGCQYLIEKGAKPVKSAKDILKEIDFNLS